MKFPPLAARLLRGVGAAMLAAGLLASCGGGSQVEEFNPDRVISFGDELSYLTNAGLKYSGNVADDNGVVDCEQGALWIQELAAHYGMVYAQCNPNGEANPDAQTLAEVDATVDDLAAQVLAFNSGDSLRSSDMVTVLVGMHDVLNAYARFPVEDESILIAEVQSAGLRLAEQVNAITETGARVLVSTIPDLGLTPFAIEQRDNNGDTDRAKLLTRLVEAFNQTMRLNLINDGSKIGLLLADDLSRAMVRVPGAYGLGNVVDAVCDAPLPLCNSTTLVDEGSLSTYLWADSTRPAIVFHGRLGDQAVSRVNNNPF